MAKWKVYISSTFTDLKEYRAALIHLFHNQLQHNFELSKIMEKMFDDGTYTPFVEDCIEAVQSCDIYIIIIGNRVGSFPPGQDKTYTEIELDTALYHDKRIFCLRLETFDYTKTDHKVRHDELLYKFKGRFIHTFNNSIELKNALYDCLIPFSSQSPINKKNPYKGLAPFDVEDGNYFFGRDAELDACLKKIVTSKNSMFVSVIGNSGTGKSSFVRAGLLFRLKHSSVLGFSHRPQIIVTPGSEPFTNLNYQLQLQGFSTKIILSGNSELILFFDQFEEIITQCHSPEAQKERKQLFNFLNTLSRKRNKKLNILVICAFRSDFLSQLANYKYIKSRQYLFPISNLDYEVHATNWEQSMTEIITRPALRNGVIIEKELVDQLLDQIKEVEGALPILQFTLKHIWSNENIEDRRICTTEYSKLSEGKGIPGIIETHAERVIKHITCIGENNDREAVLKSIFVNLVEVTENLRDVKRTVSKEELFHILNVYPKHIVDEVFEALVSEKSRLLQVSRDKNDAIYIDIIHEELIRKWERLKEWINERREALGRKKRIIHDIAAYHKGEEGLYRGEKLKKALHWKIRNPDLSNNKINTFLQKAKRSKMHRLYKRIGTALLFFIMIFLIKFAVLPYYNEKKFLEDVKNYETLRLEIIAAGGHIDLVTTLTMNESNHIFLSKNIHFFKNLKNLSVEEIQEKKDLTFLRHIDYPQGIISLAIESNNKMVSLEGIENLANLSSLSIENNDNQRNLNGVKKLKNLSSLTIAYNDSLTNLEGIENLINLNSLFIYGNDELLSLKGIENHTNLNSLSIRSSNKITSLKGIENLTNLKSLTIAYNDSLTSLEGIKNLPNLDFLLIHGNDKLFNLEGIENLINLSSLFIYGNDELLNLEGIENHINLNSLSIEDNNKLTHLKGIEKLINLKSLTIKYNYNLTSLEGIENLANLNSLSIEDNNKLINLKGVEHLTNLSSLSIKRSSNVNSLKGIEKLTDLDSLTIERNIKLININGIRKLRALRFLSIGGNHPDMNPRALYTLTQLETLQLSGKNDLGVDIKRIQRNNPGVKIVFQPY